MSSHQRDEDCIPCKIIAEKLPGLCRILGGDTESCEETLRRLQNGDVTADEVASELMSGLDEDKIEAIREWTRSLRDDLHGKEE